MQYVAEHPELNVADFCYPDDIPDLTELPPWTGKADGVVVAVHRLPGILPWLRSGRVPVVAIGSDLRKDVATVCTSPRSLARLAVEHFRRLGLRHFAYVGHRPTDGSHDRARVLADELAKHDLELQSYHTERLLSGTYRDFDVAGRGGAGVGRPDPRRRESRWRWWRSTTVSPPGSAGSSRHWAWRSPVTWPCWVSATWKSPGSPHRPSAASGWTTNGWGTRQRDQLHRLMRGERPARRAVQLPALELVERESTVGKQRAATTDIDRALEFIRQKACEDIRIEHVAAHVGVPLRTFEIQFSAATGRTVGEEIRGVRLERAKTPAGDDRPAAGPRGPSGGHERRLVPERVLPPLDGRHAHGVSPGEEG